MSSGAKAASAGGTARALAGSCHPGPCLAVTAVALALGIGAGLPTSTLALLGPAILSGQLSIGWLNDLHDRRRDADAGRSDKPLARGLVAPVTVHRALAAAIVACVAFSLALGRPAALVHLVAVGSGWVYDLRLKRTAWSFAPYALSFGLLPSVVTLALPEPIVAPWWAGAAGALLGMAIHGVNALPDIDDDRRQDAAGLPARIGPRATRLLVAGLLVAATVLLALAPPGPVSPGAWVALVVALVLAAAAVGRDWPAAARTPFVLVVVLALVDVVALVAQAGHWSAGLGTLRP